ncbi:MAG: aminotransferase class I/II-fold pyridoxal phosphate-dependent enzyme [Prevotellaceae bacterium]|jgi:histidinol-phosphate aminotransferase|nr:aminotransferase class I/II-fold pyridoxal phosphate-dependent enzyme [Prevotellaceae bacterium]
MKSIFKYSSISLLLCMGAVAISCKEEHRSTSTALQLSLNENPFDVPQNVKDSIIKELPRINRYAAADGEAFIAFVAAHEGVDAIQVIAGEILDLLGIYLGIDGGGGSEFIYSEPGYPALVNAAASVGGVIVPVPLNSRHENDLEAIAAKINSRTKAIFIVNPHNPSGTAHEAQALHDFIAHVSPRALVIVDEAYLEYAGNFEERTAIRSLQNGKNVIVFRTLAKVYGLGGLAAGYAIAPVELAKRLKEKGLGDTHALNRLSIAAAKAALSDRNNLAHVNKVITEERGKWHTFLDSLGVEHSASEANFVFFDLKKPYEEVRKALLDKGVVVGKSFASPYDTWIRISIGLPEDNVKARSAVGEVAVAPGFDVN